MFIPRSNYEGSFGDYPQVICVDTLQDVLNELKCEEMESDVHIAAVKTASAPVLSAKKQDR